MPFGIVDASRSIVLTLHPIPDLDEMVTGWLDVCGVEAIFSTAVLASPVRDNGQTEQVLAIEGLDSEQVARMVAELRIDLLVAPFHSRR